MKKILTFLILIIFMGCKSAVYVPTETKVEVRYHDSTIYHQDTIHVAINKEAYSYYSSLLDTLFMETQYASSTAYIDTTHKLLNGHIYNKPVDIPVVYKWKDHYITNDSIVYEETQVPVYIEKQIKHVPVWTFFGWIGLVLVICIWFLKKKFVF